MFLVDKHLGFFYLRLMHSLLFMLFFLLLYRLLRQYLGNRSLVVFIIMLGLILTEDRLRIRPEVFNFLGIVLIFPILVGRGKSIIRDGLWCFLLAVIWANIHGGGSVLLPLIVITVTLCRWIAHWHRKKYCVPSDGIKKEVVITLCTLIPLPFMPGYLKGVVTAFSMLEASMSLIPEWQAPFAYLDKNQVGAHSLHTILCGTVPYVTLLVIFGVFSISLVKRGFRKNMEEKDFGLMGLSCVLGVVALKSARFIYLDVFAIFSFLLFFRRETQMIISGLHIRVLLTLLGLVLMVASFEYSIIKQRKGLSYAIATTKYDHELGFFPESASDVLSKMGISGKIFHYSYWGGYLIYRHYPACTVFADGRGNFDFEQRDTLIETHKPFEREVALEKAWERYKFDIVIFPPPTFPLLTWDKSKWGLIYRDHVAEVFIRINKENEENIKKALGFWAEHGYDTGGGLEKFQTDYLKVEGMYYLSSEEAQTILKSTQDLIGQPPAIQSRGLFSRGMVFFRAYRYDEAIKMFKDALIITQSARAALYLAWAQFLNGSKKEALSTIKEYFGMPNNPSPRWEKLNPIGRKILQLLAEKLIEEGISPRSVQ